MSDMSSPRQSRYGLFLCAVLSGIVALPGAMEGQKSARAGDSLATTATPGMTSVAGTWIARLKRNAVTGGAEMLTLQLAQERDSVWGTATTTTSGIAEAPLAVSGKVRGNHFVLGDRMDTFRVESQLRDGKLEGTLIHGRGGYGSGASQASAQRGSGTLLTFTRTR